MYVVIQRLDVHNVDGLRFLIIACLFFKLDISFYRESASLTAVLIPFTLKYNQRNLEHELRLWLWLGLGLLYIERQCSTYVMVISNQKSSCEFTKPVKTRSVNSMCSFHVNHIANSHHTLDIELLRFLDVCRCPDNQIFI